MHCERQNDGTFLVPLRGPGGVVSSWATIDAGDVAIVSSGPAWREHNGRAVRTVSVDGKRTSQLMHALIAGTPRGTGLHTLHLDGDPLNNRRANLKVGTARENAREMWMHRLGRLPGCCFDRGRWKAEFWHGGKKVYVGRFKTEKQAHEAYRNKLEQLGLWNG